MEKITRYFKHDYENDTTIEFVNTPLYAMLNCSFTSEDPDYGTDTLHFTCCRECTFESIAYNMKKELSKFLDLKENREYKKLEELNAQIDYDQYSLSTLFAIESALTEISRDYHPEVRSLEGNLIQLVTVREAAELIKRTYTERKDVHFDFHVGIDPDRTLEDYSIDLGDLYHYGVKMIENDKDLFDGSGFDTDYIFLCGCYGGGNITMAYYVTNDYMHVDEQSADELIKAMCESADVRANEIILLETIEEG
jgi:hypothetical protein